MCAVAVFSICFFCERIKKNDFGSLRDRLNPITLFEIRSRARRVVVTRNEKTRVAAVTSKFLVRTQRTRLEGKHQTG